MNPNDVNPRNFKVINVLFDNEEFSIVYGLWEDGKKYLAMRWNGYGEDAGYPKTFGHPVWFLIANELKIPIIKSLVGIPNSEKEGIIKTLQDET